MNTEPGKLTDQEYRTIAQRRYAKDGELEVDPDAPVSRGFDAGAYVQAWVWVSDEEKR